MAFSQELPSSFADVLRVVKEALSKNHELIKKGVIDTEAEQITLFAFDEFQRKKDLFAKRLSRVDLYTRGGDRFPEEAAQRAIIWAHSRASGKLLQHLIGFQTFLSHEYDVSADVLVPRPETEILVAEAIKRLKNSSPQLGIEIGVGSGIISIEMLSVFPNLTMLGSELMPQAATQALKNAEKILGKADRLKIVQPENAGVGIDAFQDHELIIKQKADVIFSNPPYLTKQDAIDAEVIEQEPWSALFAPEDDPLFFYRDIARAAHTYLRPGGWVFLEVPVERAKNVLELFSIDQWTDQELVADLNQRDRVLVTRLKDKN